MNAPHHQRKMQERVHSTPNDYHRNTASHSTSVPSYVKGARGAEDKLYLHMSAGMEWFKPSDYDIGVEVISSEGLSIDNKPIRILKGQKVGPVIDLPAFHLGKSFYLIPKRDRSLPTFRSDRLTRGGTYLIAPTKMIDGKIPLVKTGGMMW